MKNLIKLIVICFSFNLLNAQSIIPPAFAQVDYNHRNYVNNVFGALEANRVPTGLLVDYGLDFTEPKFYNGVALADSTLMEQGIYSELYKTIYTSRFNTNIAALRHPTVHDSLCYIARQKEVITLSGLLFRYNAINPNAQANGTIQTINGQLRDVYINGVWQNPYQEFNTVAISPSIINYSLTYCSVVLPANLFLSNRINDISNIQFDAADGQGYRTIQYDVPLSLNYADTGWKHWKFKITLNNGQLLYSHSKIHFSSISNAMGTSGVAARGVIDRRRFVPADETFNGQIGGAVLAISFRNANDPVLRRPLIVVEGFDPGWITSPEEPEGENKFTNFVSNIRRSGSLDLQNQIADAFNPNATSEYDLVYVNWTNGTDWLQRNALVLEAVIRWVNANKQPLAGVVQPNVVLGSSMGGVIARMALGRMERGEGNFNGAGGFAAHQTRLYVSIDAPHLGANVPLGLQAFARHATSLYIGTGRVALGIEIIQFLRNGPSPLLSLTLADQPASRQMLINRIDFNYNLSNALNTQFLQQLRTQFAFPTGIRNIAISNGSECAIDQEFVAGTTLLYHYRSTKTRFLGDLIFMAAGFGLKAIGVAPQFYIPLIIPGSSKFELTLDIKSTANGGGNAVYYGNIKLTKKILWLVPVSINIADKSYNAPTGILPFDTYPGGFYTNTLNNLPGSVSQDWMFSYNNSFFVQRRFCFIPTTSALNIGQGNSSLTHTDYLARYIGETPPAAPLNSSFANFATAFNIDNASYIFNNNTSRLLNNEPHEIFYRRSANWLATEINGVTTGRTNCSVICSNGVISGNTNVCTPQTYTAPFGNGITYTWFTNSANAILTPSGNSVLVTRVGNFNGPATLSVNISGPCGSVTLSREIIIGSIPVPATSIIGGIPDNYQFCVGSSFNVYSTGANVNVTNNWSVLGGTITSGQGTPFINITLDNTPGGYAIMVPYIDGCGNQITVGLQGQIIDNGCQGSNTQTRTSNVNPLSIYPNPISDFVYLDLPSNINLKSAIVKISDAYGKLVLSKNLTSYNSKISLSNLSKGFYLIEVFNEKKRFAIKKVIKN